MSLSSSISCSVFLSVFVSGVSLFLYVSLSISSMLLLLFLPPFFFSVSVPFPSRLFSDVSLFLLTPCQTAVLVMFMAFIYQSQRGAECHSIMSN